jgi:hypothetical protein
MRAIDKAYLNLKFVGYSGSGFGFDQLRAHAGHDEKLAVDKCPEY